MGYDGVMRLRRQGKLELQPYGVFPQGTVYGRNMYLFKIETFFVLFFMWP